MIRNPRFHRGRNSQALMHTAEVIPNHEQPNSGFQVGEFLADRGRFSRVHPEVHSYAQVRSMQSRLGQKIGVSGYHVGNRRVHSAGTVTFFDCPDVAPQSTAEDLVSAKSALAQIADEVKRVYRVSLADVARKNHLGASNAAGVRFAAVEE